jgi:hypothetical protein
MAKLITDWLNEQVCLSKTITDLDGDFCDGYLIGELLWRFNQQDDFDRFLQRDNPDARINNFCLLEPTMRQIGVVFNSRIAYDIMHSKPGQMKNLLFEIKTCLDKIIKGAPKEPNKPVKNSKPLRVIPSGRPKYDISMHQTFEDVVRRDVENPNDVMMNKATARFEQKGRDYEVWLETGKSNDFADHRAELMHRKELSKQKRKHEQEFLETWNKINEEQWRQNQIRARNRKAGIAFVEETQINRKEAARTAREKHAKESTIAGIDEFEERLRTRTFVVDADEEGGGIVKTAGGEGEEGLPELMHLDKTQLDAGLLKSQKTIKQNYEELISKQQEHGRRRRRYIRERESYHFGSIQDAASSEIIYQLLNKSQSENVEESAMQRVMMNHELMKMNAENRLKLAREKEEKNAQQHNEWIIEEARREHAWIVRSRISAQYSRLEVVKEAKKAAAVCEATELAANCVDRLLDVVDWVCACRQIGSYDVVTETETDTQEGESAPVEGGSEDSASTRPQPTVIPDEFMKDARCMFSSAAEVPVASALPYPVPTNIYDNLPFSLSHRPLCASREWLASGATTSTEALTSGDILAAVLEEDFKQFLEDLNKAEVGGDNIPETIPVEKVQAPPADEDSQYNSQQVFMESPEWMFKTSSRNILGRMIASLSSVVDPIPEDPTPLLTFKDMPLRLVVCSGSSRAKTAAAAALSSKLNVEIINSKALIHNAAAVGKDIAIKMENGEWVEDEFLLEDAQEPVEEPWEEPEEECKPEPAMGEKDTAETEDEKEKETAPVVEANTPEEEKSEVLATEESENNLTEIESKIKEEPSSPVSSKPERGSVDYEAEKNRRLQKQSKERLCLQVYAALMGGMDVSNVVVAGLIAHAVVELPEGKGFVVEDFPQTKEQAVALLKAFSGIDYSTRKPTFADRATKFAPIEVDKADTIYDPIKCGLDAVIYIDTDQSQLIEQRMQLRQDLSKRGPGIPASAAETCVTYDTNNVQSLAEIQSPLLPVHSTSIATESLKDCSNSLQTFFKSLDLLKIVKLELLLKNDKDNNNEYLDAKAENDVANQVVELVSNLILPKKNKEEYIESEEKEDVPTSSETVADGENEILEETTWKPTVFPFETLEIKISQPLAKALSSIWKQGEDQSRLAALSFFNALRDVRYNMLYRRRSVLDCINIMTMRRSDYQDIFYTFRDDFNNIDDDFRFDVEVRAELVMRTMILRNTLSLKADNRKVECESLLKEFEADGVVKLLSHRIKCEGAAMMQSEVTRFTAALHVMQDYAKANSSYEASTRIANELEETLPLDGSAVTDAKAGKGGKGDAPPAPFREVLPRVILDAEMMSAIPEPGAEEPVADPKAKGKKGEAAPAANPLDAAYDKCIELAAAWGKENFTANRILYGNEALCVVLENAIWTEVERMKITVGKIKESVEKQCVWLLLNETQCIKVAQQAINEAYNRELATTERLSDLVLNVIEDCSCITDDWLVAADAIAVQEGRVLVAPAEPDPAPTVDIYDSIRLNDKQIQLATEGLRSIALGGFSTIASSTSASSTDTVLLEDVINFATTVSNSPGPLATTHMMRTTSEGAKLGTFANMAIPSGWQGTNSELITHLETALSEKDNTHATGVVSIVEACESLKNFETKLIQKNIPFTRV